MDGLGPGPGIFEPGGTQGRLGLKVGTYAAHSGHGVDMGLCF